MSRFQSQIDLILPYVEIVENPKTAQQACQAVPLKVVDGIGHIPNRLPLILMEISSMRVLTSEIVKYRQRYLLLDWHKIAML